MSIGNRSQTRSNEITRVLVNAGVALLLAVWTLTSVATLMVSDSYVKPALERTTRLSPGETRQALSVVSYLDSGSSRELRQLSEGESSHMADVLGLVNLVAVVGFMCTIGLVVGGIFAWSTRRFRDFLGLIKRCSLYGEVTLGLLLAAAALGFDRLFTLFHEIFFPQGNWLFEPGSALVTLFPERFWLVSSVVLFAGSAAWLGAVAFLAWRFEKTGPT